MILALDGGQTSTKGCLVDLAGNVLASAVGGPVTRLVTPEGRSVSEASVRTVLEALRAAVPEGAVRVASVGFSGLTPAGEPYLRAWLSSYFEVGEYLLSKDAPVNLASDPSAPPHAVVVIAGGGSVAWARAADGSELVAGGGGHVFGDEGSGWQIGLSAVKAALQAVDGRGPATGLVEALCKRFDLAEIGSIKDRYYSGQINDLDLAQLLPLVVEVARAGDKVARRLLITAGADLGRLANAVLGRLQAPPYVVATGGVFAADPLLWESFVETVRGRFAEAVVVRPRFSPLLGAALLGLRRAGVTVDEAVLQRLEASAEAVVE